MHFTINDNFESIIKNTINGNIISINKIPTGWTNYVFNVKTAKKGSFIFRFPRNDFFAETLVKEEFFNRYISKKTSFKIAKLKLFYHEGKPFTVHKFIKGKALTECYQTLTVEEKIQLGKDIARFISELQKLDIASLEKKFKKERLKLESLSEFLEGLSRVGSDKYELDKHNFLIELEREKKVLSHADFNPGNILLNKENKMFAVLDFAFVSCSCDLVDISRVIGRLPKEYANIILAEYEKYMDKDINVEKVYKIIEIWNYVEKKYIEYIREFHTDIQLPV